MQRVNNGTQIDSAYTLETGHGSGMHVGNPTSKQKTLDVHLVQADGQYSPT